MTPEGRALFFAMYRLTPEEADLISEGYVRYRNKNGEYQWSKEPIDGWKVDRDTIIPSTMTDTPKFERDYMGRVCRVTNGRLDTRR